MAKDLFVLNNVLFWIPLTLWQTSDCHIYALCFIYSTIIQITNVIVKWLILLWFNISVREAARKSVGGGFSFVFNGQHYIYGLLSSQVVRRDEIEYLKDQNYPVFTNITHTTHRQWIDDTILSWQNVNLLSWSWCSSMKSKCNGVWSTINFYIK